MNRTAKLGLVGQSVWLDNITRGLLDSGKLRHYIDELSVTGLTSNPSIYDKAIGGSSDYDEQDSATFRGRRKDGGDLLRPGAGRPASGGRPVPADLRPDRRRRRVRLARGLAAPGDDSATTAADATRLHALAGRPNFFIKIPGTAAGLKAIEQTI